MSALDAERVAGPRSGRPAVAYKWIALSNTSLGALLGSLNLGTLIIALPVILRDLHASLVALMWIVLSYMLVTGGLVLNVGRLGDMFGRSRLYKVGFAVFTLGSLLSGLAQSAGQLIAFRCLTGVGGALLMANSAAIVTDAFPASERGFALGVNQVMYAAGQIGGPILGGALAALSWRWVFWFNVPVGLLGTAWAYAMLRDVGHAPRVTRIDYAGNALFLAGVTTVLAYFSFAPIYGWTAPGMLLALFAGTVGLAAFVFAERRAAEPMLRLELFARPVFALNNLTAFLNSLARMAVMILLVLYLQGPKAYDPVVAGLLLTPMAAALLVCAPIAGRLSDRHGSRWYSFLGLLATAVGLGGLATIGPSTSYTQLAIWMALVGGGSGFFNSPNSSAVMGAVPPALRGTAAGTRMTVSNVGGIFSIAISLGLVLNSMPPQVMMAIFAGTQLGVGGVNLAPFYGALRSAFGLSACISLAAALIALWPGGWRPGEAPESTPADSPRGDAERSDATGEA